MFSEFFAEALFSFFGGSWSRFPVVVVKAAAAGAIHLKASFFKRFFACTAGKLDSFHLHPIIEGHLVTSLNKQGRNVIGLEILLVQRIAIIAPTSIVHSPTQKTNWHFVNHLSVIWSFVSSFDKVPSQFWNLGRRIPKLAH